MATTPFAVNAFLRRHFEELGREYDLSLGVNLDAYPLLSEIRERVNVVHVDFHRKISVFGDVKSLVQMLVLVWRLKPDAIHSITPKAGLLAMLAGFVLRTRLRYHTFTGQVWANKSGAPRLLLKSLDRLISTLATQVFTDSVSQREFLIRERIVTSTRVSMLGRGSISGVDLRRFRPDHAAHEKVRATLATKLESCVFIFVGRLVRDKGVFELLEAFRCVADCHPNAELWIVGPDEAGLLSHLKVLGEGTAARVRWIGPTPSPEIYMAGADVIVLPSYREGFGSVVIEAAACGIPCIASRIDGIVDAVVDGQTGLLVEAGNVTDLASVMSSLCENRELRKKLGLAARERATEQFSSEAVTAEWARFYHSVL